MEHRVKPLAHDHAFLELLMDLLFAKRLEEHEANRTIEGSRVQPAWKKSLAHDWGEVAFLDVEHIGHGEDGASEIG